MLLGEHEELLVQQAVLAQDLAAALQQRLACVRVVPQRLPQVSLGQTEQVGVADTAHSRCPPVTCRVAGNLQHAHLWADITLLTPQSYLLVLKEAWLQEGRQLIMSL